MLATRSEKSAGLPRALKPFNRALGRVFCCLWAKLACFRRASIRFLGWNEFHLRKVWWFFMKCWDDGLVEDAYNLTINWFANPPLPENKVWAQNSITQQYKNNQATYPKAGLPSYPNGAYMNYSKLYFDEVRKSTWLFNYTKYWKPGDPDPERCPVAGGKGPSVPPGKC